MSSPIAAPSIVARLVAATAAAAVLLGACGGAATPSAPQVTATPTPAPTAQPTPSPATTPAPAPTPTLTPGATPAARPTPAAVGAPGTTTIAWGEIWNDVPASYPVPDDARREEPGSPASAAWMRGGRYRAIADGMLEKLKAAGWTIEAVGEGEQTSVVIDATKGSPDCRTRVTVEAFDIGVRITALYGAACPWE